MAIDSDDDTLDAYKRRLQNLDIDKLITEAHTKLTQWQTQCQQTIDELYRRKKEELVAYADEAKRQYEGKKTTLQSCLDQLSAGRAASEGNPVDCEQILQTIRESLDDLEQMSIDVEFEPLILPDDFARIGRKVNFSLRSASRRALPYSARCSSALASNDRRLLLHQGTHLCLLDQDLQEVKQSPWDHGWIHDMCWSSTASLFFILTRNALFAADDELNSIMDIPLLFQQAWFSCTCSPKSLYLSTCQWGSSIHEYNLDSPRQFVREWKSPTTCAASEGLNDIKYNNGTLALAIKDSQSHARRMVLKTAATFDTLWVLDLGVSTNIRLLTCSPLTNDEWLFIDGANLQSHHISQKGKIIESMTSTTVPYRANLFASKFLALATEFTLNFCRFAR